MRYLNLDQFRNLKSVLKSKEQCKFTIACHDSRGMLLHDKIYRLINEEYKGIYDPYDDVSIDIFKDRVELHIMREGSRRHVSNFNERELSNLYDMAEIEMLEFSIIKAVDKWNGYYYD